MSKKKNPVIRGKFGGKDAKKERKKMEEKRRQRIMEERDMQCRCNHRKPNGDTALKEKKGDRAECKNCGGMLYTSEEVLNKQNIDDAIKVIYSVAGRIRHETPLNNKMDKSFDDFNRVLFLLPELNDEITKRQNSKGGKNGNKKNNQYDFLANRK